MKHKTRDYLVKFEQVQDSGWFCGYASVPVVDSYGDTILPGSFKMSLSTRKPVLLWNHDTSMPIGSIRAIKDTESGLYFEADLNLDVEKGREVYSLIKRGDITGISIGYKPVNGKFEKDRVNGGIIMREVELFEVSIVAIPANTSAQVMAVKSGLIERLRDLTENEINLLENLLSIMSSLKNMDPVDPITPAAEVEGVNDMVDNTSEEVEEEDMIFYRALESLLPKSASAATDVLETDSNQSLPLADELNADPIWLALKSLVIEGDNHGPKENSR